MSEAQPALFISYAPDGQHYADKLKSALEAREISVQMAGSRDESPDEARTIEAQINEAQIDECATYVLVMTPEAKDSEAVTAELAIAQKLAKP
ncbi:MAG: toll/interleukin-1 receptor domain-containing protein, partial [Cyanobacteria bacterium J06635_11]